MSSITFNHPTQAWSYVANSYGDHKGIEIRKPSELGLFDDYTMLVEFMKGTLTNTNNDNGSLQVLKPKYIRLSKYYYQWEKTYEVIDDNYLDILRRIIIEMRFHQQNQFLITARL